MRNVLVVISGPSGVGKGTIARLLTEREGYALSVSCTTRAPRQGETNGKEYFFISKSEFEKKISVGGLLEYSEHFGNYYGTPKDFVTERLKEKDVILEIDVNGGLAIKENYPQAVLIMILPPSLEEVERRLKKRNTEGAEEIALRMKRISYEIGKTNLYDYSVVNADLNESVREIIRIIDKEKRAAN